MRFFMIRSRSSQIQLLFCDTVSNGLLVEPDLDAPFFNLCFFVIFCLLWDILRHFEKFETVPVADHGLAKSSQHRKLAGEKPEKPIIQSNQLVKSIAKHKKGVSQATHNA